MRTSSKVVLAVLGLGGITYVGRKCWRNARRGSARLPNERERQARTVTEDCLPPSAAPETTATTDTTGNIQAINQDDRGTSKDLGKWLATVRLVLLDVVDVSFWELLSYRLLTHIGVNGLNRWKEASLNNRVLDTSLSVVAVFGVGFFMGGKLLRKINAWKVRLKGAPAQAATGVNRRAESSQGQRVRDVIWEKVKALRRTVYNFFDFWEHFALVEQVVIMNRLLIDINRIDERQIAALQESLGTSQELLAIRQSEVDTLQAELDRQVAEEQDVQAFATARALLYEYDRRESLIAQQ